jgi:ribonucleoside-triphosphate reductase
MLKLQKQLKVKKRDGQIVPFDAKKIEGAIKLSAERTRKTLSDNFCDKVVTSTLENLMHRGLIMRPIDVDDIHLSVENALWEVDKELYNEYRSYNNYKKRFNHSFNNILKDAKNIIYEGDKENANKDSCIVSTKRDLVSSLVGKELYLEYELAPHLADAHKNLDFYIHDAGDRFYNSINCCLFDVANVLEGGFNLNGKFIEEPSNPEDAMEKALDLLNDIILVASSQQYGRQ